MDFFEFLRQQEWYNYLTAVIAIASTIAALTRTPSNESKFAFIYKFIDYLALNIGKAKDKGDEEEVIKDEKEEN